MRRLILLRHAKSSWTDLGQSDFDRPLAPRGLEAAPQMANHMADHDLIPGAVICSPARRTRATLALLLETLPAPASVRFERALYDGAEQALLDLVRSSDDAHETVMVVGHNPTMHDVALLLAEPDDTAQYRELSEKYPTGALAVITFAGDRWAAIMPGEGTLRAFVKPRDLASS